MTGFWSLSTLHREEPVFHSAATYIDSGFQGVASWK